MRSAFSEELFTLRALKIKLNPAGPRPNLSHSKALNAGSGTQHEPCPGLKCKLNAENKADIALLKGKAINGPCCGFSWGHKRHRPSFYQERSANSNQTSHKGKKLIVPARERDSLSPFEGEKRHLIHPLIQRGGAWSKQGSAVCPVCGGTHVHGNSRSSAPLRC